MGLAPRGGKAPLPIDIPEPGQWRRRWPVECWRRLRPMERHEKRRQETERSQEDRSTLRARTPKGFLSVGKIPKTTSRLKTVASSRGVTRTKLDPVEKRQLCSTISEKCVFFLKFSGFFSLAFNIAQPVDLQREKSSVLSDFFKL